MTPQSFNYLILTKQFKESIADGQILRYGENPHQKDFLW
jgi:AICAR transformylase/IMP cyclohydrolase PurH